MISEIGREVLQVGVAKRLFDCQVGCACLGGSEKRGEGGGGERIRRVGHCIGMGGARADLGTLVLRMSRDSSVESAPALTSGLSLASLITFGSLTRWSCGRGWSGCGGRKWRSPSRGGIALLGRRRKLGGGGRGVIREVRPGAGVRLRRPGVAVLQAVNVWRWNYVDGGGGRCTLTESEPMDVVLEVVFGGEGWCVETRPTGRVCLDTLYWGCG